MRVQRSPACTPSCSAAEPATTAATRQYAGILVKLRPVLRTGGNLDGIIGGPEEGHLVAFLVEGDGEIAEQAAADGGKLIRHVDDRDSR